MNTEGSFQCDCPLGHELSPSREDCIGEFSPFVYKKEKKEKEKEEKRKENAAGTVGEKWGHV